MLEIDLQKFADDEDELPDDLELDEEQIEEEDGEPTDEDTADEQEESEGIEEQTKPEKDKKTAAIIKAKQEAKRLRDELAKYKQAEKDAADRETKERLKAQYKADGLTDDQAEEKIASREMKRELEELKFITKNQVVISKYPEAMNQIDRLKKIQEVTGWSLEKICQNEFCTADEFDIKTKTEQAALLTRRKQVKSKPISGGDSTLASTKLDSDDERAYQTYVKFNPGISRKQYQEKVLNAINQKIPHDKWE